MATDPPLTVRPQRAADRDAVRNVLTAAFGRPAVADLSEALQIGAAAQRAGALVAELAGELVGQVQLSTSWVDAPERVVPVLVLSPLGVLPEQQGRGIGSELVRAALAMAAELDAPAVFLEGSPRYYPRFGFEPAGRHGFSAPSVRIPAAAFQVVLLESWQPWMVGALAYADPFWAFDCVGLRETP
ncbi:MAG: N-acetyltransferase [Actinomycetota bacterium]|nr:N-acetyltransferase [Actinomycetota bacterium]MDQ2955715.1 N-acetyltransferase [Actinomycetota bacterium]